MSIFRQVANIPAADTMTAAIGTFQGATKGALLLNGPLVNNYTGQVSFIDGGGYASTIIISMGVGASLTNVSFTIFGTFNGFTISEVINGPDENATVETTNLFHTITSITIGTSVLVGFTIGAAFSTAVMLNTYNLNSGTSYHPNYNYNIFFNSKTANADIPINTIGSLGVTGSQPLMSCVFQNFEIANNVYTINKQEFTIAQLHAGVITQTTYPFSAVVFILPEGINTTPFYVEIIQS